ncbi:MAG: DUF2066 domain-containing protein [Pseudomonas sp.]
MGFKQGLRALLSGTVMLASAYAPAAVLDNLYQVQIPRQEGQSRDEVMRAASVIMLQRLAGSDVSLKSEPIAKALKAPQDLMSRIGSAEGGQLRIQFEPDALSKVLKQSGQPLLGPNRPGILLWAVEAGELGDRTLSPVAPDALLLKQAAQHRGVALSFPLGDLQDMALVDEATIRQASSEPLLEASQRYPAEGTLALVIGGTESDAELNWTLWLNDERKSGRIRGTAEQAADELMQRLANLIFKQYAIPAATVGKHTEWQLQVDGVDSVGAYSGLLGMLRRLGTQQQSRLLEINGDRVLLQVSFPGTEEQLERMLDLDMRLQRIPEPIAEPAPEPVVPVSDSDAAINVQETAALEVDGIEVSTMTDPNADEPQLPAAEDAQADEEVTAPAAPQLPTLYFRWHG